MIETTLTKPSAMNSDYGIQTQILDVSIILPTYNEADNISIIIPKICACLENHKLSGEIIVMDDNSPDGTAKKAELLQAKYPVRVINRINKKRGLAYAVLDGFDASMASVCLVMDADMSHPIEALPHMIKPILNGETDITVGSRLVPGGGMTDWVWYRRWMSRFAGMLTLGLTPLKDPTSGFMAIRSELYQKHHFQPIGWKIVLEIVSRLRTCRVKEVPILFKDREHGKSKMSLKVQGEYIKHVLELYQVRFPAFFEFLKFGLVGLSGVGVDMLGTSLGLHVFQLPILQAACVGFVIALTTNYILNRFWTFNREQKKHPLKEYTLFWAVCMLGLGARLGVMKVLMTQLAWFDVHPMVLNLIGIVIASIVNFAGSRHWVF